MRVTVWQANHCETCCMEDLPTQKDSRSREARDEKERGRSPVRGECLPSCESTEGEDDRRVVVVAVVLAHRADLPGAVKTRPWRLRTDRLPELSEVP